MTRPTVAIKRVQADIDRYTELLTRDWTERSLTGTLSLMRDVLVESGLRLAFHWELAAHRKRPDGPRSYPIPPNASEELREFLERMNARDLPRLPDRLPSRTATRKAELAHQTEAVAYLLTLQSDTPVTGEYGFWLDLQSLLFLQATHVQLEVLLRERMADEANYLAHALSYHAQVIWAHRPEHQHFLISQLAEAVGAQAMARRSLNVSFALTSAEDHDYITKAQAVWLHLMEHRDYAGAKRFILHVIRHAPEAHVAELELLLDETYEEGRAA